jgi:multidrug efflux pump subunit AcrA (membrane-fusion protein)
VRIQVKNPERLLKVGMFAQARIGLQEKKGVLVVPPSAVSKTDVGTAVYVVAGEEATRTPVKIGLETPDGVEVVSGVQEGQKVLTSAIHGLAERAKLAAKP